MTKSNFEVLKAKMNELRDLAATVSLCEWDRETFMPPKAGGARSAQLSTLQGLYHERLVCPQLGDLLEAEASRAPGEDAKAMIRVLRHQRERAVRMPGTLVRALAEAQSEARAAWQEARKNRSFSLFAPGLSRLLRLRREQADAYGHEGERYDALLEAYEPSMTVARLTPVLTRLKEGLVPLVGALAERTPAHAPLRLEGLRFETDKQWQFTLELLRDMGFDLDAGRQDRSVHPFSTGNHPHDVRLTTRLFEDNLMSGLFSTIHEGGHGLYEQGFSEALYRTPLAQAPSMGLHESQSRLWENLIGRSRAFWRHYLPRLQAFFPAQLGGASVDAFLSTINRVARTPIRTDADEVTYNLHIILRYELELALLHDDLRVEDLPAEWNRRSQALLGYLPKHDVEGVLQDIHWAWGEFGYFPTYALGNLYAASIAAAARRAMPDLDEQVAAGNLLGLREWLRVNLHAHGYRTPAEERVRAVTGHGLREEDFLSYLQGKYGELYGL